MLGHECLGRVIDAPSTSGFERGDLVVGIVRRPDPEPCAACASERWDMCLNGRYTERGIQGLHGYTRESYLLEPAFAIKVDQALGLAATLLEPASIVTKVWRRALSFAALNEPSVGSVLVTGAGPIGLLAALLGQQHGLEVHVLDRAEQGPKPVLVRALGASYHLSLDTCPEVDVVMECTGAGALIPEAIGGTSRNGIVCLTGVTEHDARTVDVGALNRELVLENDVVLGSVNAARLDYEQALEHLLAAQKTWLSGLITRRVALDAWREAYEKREDGIKTLLVF